MRLLTLLALFLASPLDDFVILAVIYFLKGRNKMFTLDLHSIAVNLFYAVLAIGGLTLLNLYLKSRATR